MISEVELIRRHYGNFNGIYDHYQAVAHVRVLLDEIRRLGAQRDKVLALHTEFDGRCTECVEYCDCLGDECTHGSVEWPCPTAAVYAEPAPADPTAETPLAEWERELLERDSTLLAEPYPDLRHQITAVLDQFEGSFYQLNADLMAREIVSEVIAPLMADEADLADINRRVAAEQNVLEKVKAWRAALPWQTGVPRDKYAERLADTQDALCTAVDALPAEREGGA